MTEKPHLSPIVRRGNGYFNGEIWLKLKNEYDGIDKNLWRIEDKLYDFRDFALSHPGGADWINITRGTDITEAFEVVHVFGNENKDQMLEKYYVKNAVSPRSSPYTFKRDGFYMTLKRRVQKILKEVGSGPTREMLFIQDGLMVLFLVTFSLAIYHSSIIITFIAGILLGMTFTAAHNFFHMKDNFRMYYWDFSTYSSYEWRITHMISHHLHTNTFHDYEMFGFFPFIDLYANKNKSFIPRFLGPLYVHTLVAIGGPCQYFVRLASGLLGKTRLRPENMIALVQLLAFLKWSRFSWITGLGSWTLMHYVAGFWLSFTTLIWAHHHPRSYHGGDFVFDNHDWGIQQLDSIRDVKSENLFIIVTTLKNHTLHHLFPSVDHSKLHHFYPALLETCREFKIHFEYISAWEMLMGFHRQMMRKNRHDHTQRLAFKQVD